jgi:hypothetical protein
MLISPAPSAHLGTLGGALLMLLELSQGLEP